MHPFLVSLYMLLVGNVPKPPFYQGKPDKLKAALQSIAAWVNQKGNQTPGKWQITRTAYARRLEHLIGTFELNQGNIDCCVFAATLFSMLWYYPEEAARFGMDLYDNGEASLGNLDGTVNIKPNNTLLATTPAQVSEGDGYPPFVDWILLSSIIDSFYSDIAYYGKTDQNGVVRIDPDTHENVIGFFPKFFTFQGRFNGIQNNGVDIAKLSTENKAVFMWIGASRFKARSFGGSFLNFVNPVYHCVALCGPFEFYNSNQNVKYPVHSYAEKVNMDDQIRSLGITNAGINFLFVCDLN
ncbi:MAG TPA: hypothetical protein VNA26_02280 [Chitinophagaceae bacterium]|nr:hypothetical protein [Chitinophagaceae bacterium]